MGRTLCALGARYAKPRRLKLIDKAKNQDIASD
jgi:hypothetical protein